jgi:phospholipid-binding lipoprotein MlaA
MNPRSFRRASRIAACVAGLVLAAGCATGPDANPADPLEPLNRQVTRFNDAVDDAVMKPVATAYQSVVPSLVRKGVSNFFDNLGDVWNLVNNMAQLKLQNSLETFMRLNVNTVFGLGGLLDIATEAGIDRHSEDFGQTLGHWGIGSGPYLVLPLLGPSTLRDAAALPVDAWGGSPISYVSDIPARNSLYALEVVDTRSNLLSTTRLLGEAALDKYSFTRDAFLQRRLNQVYDGNPPEEDH